MREVICALKSKDMLHSKDVVRLKIYIRRKYSDSEPKSRAFILADAIHRLLDRHLVQFRDNHREEIKKRLLHLAVSRGSFAINGQDVFKSYLLIDDHTDELMESMTGWLNAQQSIKTISLATLKDFIVQIRPYTPDLIQLDLDMFLDQVEEKLTLQSQSTENYQAVESYIEVSAAEEIKATADDALIGIQDSSQDIPVAVHEMPAVGIITKTHSDINFLYSTVWSSIPSKSRTQRVLDYMESISASGLDWIRSFFHKLPVSISFLRKMEFDRNRTVVVMVLAALLVLPLVVMIPYIADIISPPSQPQMPAKPDGLPIELRYHEINTQQLKTYLASRNSLLADEPHFSEIIKTSKEFDIHPLLMFAITGQEQGFVPRDSSNAYIKASNPFNVYGSWTEYNGNITDSTRVAAQTVVNLSKDRPPNTDPFAWINRKYAEDKEWWIGVKSIFEDLEQHVGSPPTTNKSN